MSDDAAELQIQRRSVRLPNPDKVMFPDAEITKADLVTYYRDVSDLVLPHLEGRPLVLERYPDGIGEDGFYQKEAGDHFPDWLRTAEMQKEGGTVNHVVCDDEATLAYLVGQAMITPHVWLSRVDEPDRAEQLVFDLDPSDGLGAVPEAAGVLHDLLDEIELVAFAKSSGSRGIHVHVPLDGAADFGEARRFARDLADLAAERHPDLLTTAQRKEKRQGRLFLDINRNAYAQTAVAPFGVRARPGAPVAVTLDWDEATSSSFDPRAFTIENVFRRLSQKDDPWAGWRRRARSLTEPRKRLEEMIEVSA